MYFTIVSGVDIEEVDNEYVLQAELPGVPKENINIQIDNDHLTISVQQEKQTADESPNYIRKKDGQVIVQEAFI